MILSFLVFLLVICSVVIIHEFGHYSAAILCGVHVEEFSIGFGKAIKSFVDKNKTKWSVRLIPLGGYVKMKGDTNVASFSNSKNDIKKLPKDDVNSKTPLQKCFMSAAGPLSNFLVAIIIFLFIFVKEGEIMISPVIETVLINSVAHKAGLKEGDLIKSIDGHKIQDFRDIKKALMLSTDKEIELIYTRYNVKNIIKINFPDQNNKQLGISSSNVKYNKIMFDEAIVKSFGEVYDISKVTLIGLKQIILNQRSIKEIGGPLKIAQYSSKVSKTGLISILNFIAVISVNLGLINIFPIPLLDGGHIFIYSIEMIIRRELPVLVKKSFYYFGIFFIGLLTIVSTYNDISQIVIQYFKSKI